MKRIKEMIESAPTKGNAIQMLETWRMLGNITEDEYQRGRGLVRKCF
jgi:hypothetical protein